MPNPQASAGNLAVLSGLGWEWCENGVIVRVCLNNHCYRVLIPLARVWHEFNKELSAVGMPFQPSVGMEPTVGGLFGSIVHAVSHAASSATKAITHAASTITKDAASVATHALGKIPVLGTVVKAATNILELPSSVADQLAHGGRIDRVAMGSLKTALASVKAVAPYATTVLSLVPGVGQGLSGAIGAGLALASGQNITDALTAGVRSALPGGALAASAFDLAHAAMQGKPISAIALQALPISPQAKDALTHGIAVARDLAQGKNVSQAVVDAATHQLPKDLQKAIQIGAAIGHAKNLQSAVGAVASAATLSNHFQQGIAAAHAIRALPPRAVVPPALVSAVQRGLKAKAVVDNAHAHAEHGHPDAIRFLGALQAHAKVAAQAQLPQGHKAFRPRYHVAPSVSGPLTSFMHHPRSALQRRSVPALPAQQFWTQSHIRHAYGR